MEEIWKDCSFDSRYKVSNLGNVKRITANGDSVFIKGSILKCGDRKTHSYRYLQIIREGKRKNYLFHRLVCIAFKENPNDYPYVDHIDRDTFNNNVDNLRWCSQEINMRNTLRFRDDVKEEDPKLRKKILHKEYGKKHGHKALVKYTCECGSVLSKCNKSAHLKSKKHLSYIEESSLVSSNSFEVVA